MYWFIFCPIRGLYHTCPDDHKGEKNVIEVCKELVDDIKNEGYKLKDIIIIRGERKAALSPSKEYQLVSREAD